LPSISSSSEDENSNSDEDNDKPHDLPNKRSRSNPNLSKIIEETKEISENPEDPNPYA